MKRPRAKNLADDHTTYVITILRKKMEAGSDLTKEEIKFLCNVLFEVECLGRIHRRRTWKSMPMEKLTLLKQVDHLVIIGASVKAAIWALRPKSSVKQLGSIAREYRRLRPRVRAQGSDISLNGDEVNAACERLNKTWAWKK